MKIAPRDIDRFLRAPDAAIRLVLLYGPDRGLVRERAVALVTAVAGDVNDPFRVSELSAAEIKADGARLADEAAAMALTGGRRAVRIRDADDALAARVKTFLAEASGDSLVVLEAEDLPARSTVRKAVEAASAGATVACYRDDERSLPAVIEEILRASGLSAAPEAIAHLASHLGGDRQLTRAELEKLALYMGDAGRRVELEDAQVCVGDSAALTLDDLAFAVGGGDLAAVDRALTRSFQEGANPVSALRAVARHLQRLHLVAGLVGGGVPRERAVKQLRPPVFWKLTARFEAQANAWSPQALARALDRLLTAEMACKRSGAPAELLCARALTEVTARAPRGRRRAG